MTDTNGRPDQTLSPAATPSDGDASALENREAHDVSDGRAAPDDGSSAGSIKRLLEIMARLRNPDGGCPWDVEQTFATIAPYTIEEAYEVADAIARGDLDDLRDELGDLLLQVVFHARMAEERRAFAFADVVAAICDKMVRRHPHVFASDDDGAARGGVRIGSAAEQTRAWERHKAAERQAAERQAAKRRAADDGRAADGGTLAGSSALDGVTIALPALTRAAKLQKRAAAVGFDWPDVSGALDKVAEECAELRQELDRPAAPQEVRGSTPPTHENRDGAAPGDAAPGDAAPGEAIEDEVGDLLFACVNVARKLELDPEAALRRANAKFERRFRWIENHLHADRGRRAETTSLDELEALWQWAKDAERS